MQQQQIVLKKQASFPPGTKVVAVPLSSADMSPFKIEKPAILPKTIQIITTPHKPPGQQRYLASVNSQPTILSGKRHHDFPDSSAYTDIKRKKGEKGGKGLRHFSMKVCEKVKRKGTTSYNEVADELVHEFADPYRVMSPNDQAYDHKNIRRRVYDALNVLMAMNIISKEKKEIRWLGLPTNSAKECETLERERNLRKEGIRVKTKELQGLLLQQVAFKNLVKRNKEIEKLNKPPAPDTAIQLPFIIVNTNKKTIIDCSISNDKMEYLFSFDNTFEIHDDIEVLKRMGMAYNLEKGLCTDSQLDEIRKMVPKALESYVIKMAESGPNQGIGSSSFSAGPSGITTSDIDCMLSANGSNADIHSSTNSRDSTDCEVALVNHNGSSSEAVLPTSSSRPDTSSPEDDFSDLEEESDRSTPIEVN